MVTKADENKRHIIDNEEMIKLIIKGSVHYIS